MKHSDKMFMGMTTSPENSENVLGMGAILFGSEFLEQNAVTTGNCNGNCPLVWDQAILGAMRVFNRRNQPVLCSTFVLGGANTPLQLPLPSRSSTQKRFRPWPIPRSSGRAAPQFTVYFLSTVSMQTGTPMAGTPETLVDDFMIGQVGAHYIWHSSGLE